MTQRELEEKISRDEFSAKQVVMIQCVGSREEGHMYCSRVCCSSAIKNSLKIKELSPETEVYVLYRDIRTYGYNEDYFQEAREKGVIFIRYDLDKKPEVSNSGDLEVRVVEPMLDCELVLNPDALVLSSRIEPNPDNEILSQILKVPMTEDSFFLEAHSKLRPVDFSTEGFFLAGMAHAPKTMTESIAQGEAAAARAATILSKDRYEAEATIASINEEICAACGICVSVCEYSAIEIVERRNGTRVAKLNEILCKGCGACFAACPRGVIEQRGFRNEQILEVIDSVLA